VVAFAVACVACAAREREPLPRLNIQPGSLTVSGLSSGGYMATQYQVAYAKDVTGAGIVAAGPWFCAQGLLTRAMRECLEGRPAGPDVAPLVATLRASARAGVVDDPSWLAPDRVWIFHGARDDTVGAAVVDALVRFYRAFVPTERIRYETEIEAGHGFPADGQGRACEASEPPWINDCGFDAAGLMLRHFHDDLRLPARAVSGELAVFDQSRYADGGRLASLDERGLVFVPKDCAAGQLCRIHVAFHGCKQGMGFVGRDFARDAGFNRWADANRIVVLYPQVKRSVFWPFNPNGCWDWWGYSGANYASRDGLQLRAVRRMIAALGG
jgi:poly(3-hydroxybutyrate) depolymerase